ncbi:hypothetical protein TWF506_005222 [Arthrobotrys conoides]|uniref:Uncharacterized protein n=1 Tax=Arthrobotrys conoides TaxID=74498 RepID=A0AAN8NBF2_9PEZI
MNCPRRYSFNHGSRRFSIQCLGGHNDDSISHYDPLRIMGRFLSGRGIMGIPPWFHGFVVDARFGGDVRDRCRCALAYIFPFTPPSIPSAVVRGGQGLVKDVMTFADVEFDDPNPLRSCNLGG